MDNEKKEPKETMKEKLHNAAEDVKEKAAHVKEDVKNGVEKAKEKAHDVKEHVKDDIHKAKEKMAENKIKKEQEKELVFTIENTGVHIPEQDFGRIFDAFYRVDSSRNRKNGGSGLGLYIVREILEQHGAWYEMKNTKKGVLFQFKIGHDACNRK